MLRSHKWSLNVRTCQCSHDAILALMELDIKGDGWPCFFLFFPPSCACVRKSAQTPPKKGDFACNRWPQRCSSSKLQSPHMIDDLGEALIIDYAEVKGTDSYQESGLDEGEGKKKKKKKKKIYKNYFSPQKLWSPVPPFFCLGNKKFILGFWGRAACRFIC